jgi:putative integral membrane protein (TIGR02587 family)
MPAGSGALLERDANREYAIGLARAFGGAIIFAFPLLMTMEMWWLGLYLERDRLMLFVLLNFVLLAGLSYYTGFERADGVDDIVMDALTAFGVGAIASAMVLVMFGLLDPAMPGDEIVGKITLQAIPASIGAAVARKLLTLGDEADPQRERNAGYLGQLFLMAAGAVFLSFNVAPTEEMMLIAFKLTPWHAIALVLFSVVLLHAFVYGVGFAGQEQRPEGAGFLRTFLHYTVTGYAIALLVSLYVLWTLGRMDDPPAANVVAMTVVLGFPASVGAAIARLIV